MKKASVLKVKDLPMDQIDEPHGRIRMDIDPEGIKDLAENIAEVGLLQPIIVRPEGERFEIVAGHRRFLAFQLLKKENIPANVRDMDNVSCALARASENLGRVGLSPIEEAAIYAELRDEHDLTVDEISNRMGKSAGIVKRRLDLLKMPPQLQRAVHIKAINYSVAEELWSLGDDSAIDYFLGYAVDHGATQSVVRGWVKDWKDEQRRKESGTGGGGGVPAPLETRPVYVPCDLCLQAMELGSETLFRACSKCAKVIVDAVKGQG